MLGLVRGGGALDDVVVMVLVVTVVVVVAMVVVVVVVVRPCWSCWSCCVGGARVARAWLVVAGGGLHMAFAVRWLMCVWFGCVCGGVGGGRVVCVPCVSRGGWCGYGGALAWPGVV